MRTILSTSAAALVATFGAMAFPASAAAAPYPSDNCSPVNGIPAQQSTRACSSIGNGGVPSSYGQPGQNNYAVISNGYELARTEAATTSSSDDGYTVNAGAVSNSGNAVSNTASLGGRSVQGIITNGNVAYTTGSFSYGRIGDILTFTNASGSTQVFDIGYALAGTVQPGGFGFEGYNDGSVFLALSQPGTFYGPIRYANSGGYIDSGFTTSFNAVDGTISSRYAGSGTAADYTASQSFDPATGQVRASYLTSLLIPTGTSSLAVALTLALDCRARGVACDFSDGARLRLGALPQGLSYTSGSGRLAGNGSLAAAVPEPGTWAMTIGGLGLVGAGLRRRVRMPAAATTA